MNEFETLNSIDVSKHIEDKNGLSYLSWTWAWTEFKKKFPTANYEIVKTPSGLPYVYDELTGYMVYTKVTVGNLTHEMWLPVMDSGNNAMKASAYDVTNKWGKKFTVKAATMFDINKTIMRCLTKNLAMFGLGLYVYAGEDLPEEVEAQEKQEKPAKAPRQKKEAPVRTPAPESNMPADLEEALATKLPTKSGAMAIGAMTDDQLVSMMNYYMKKDVSVAKKIELVINDREKSSWT